jgi:hypothetical protein
VLPTVQTIEVGDPINAKQHGLAIEDKLLRSNATRCFDDERVVARPVVPVAGEQANAVMIPLDD